VHESHDHKRPKRVPPISLIGGVEWVAYQLEAEQAVEEVLDAQLPPTARVPHLLLHVHVHTPAHPSPVSQSPADRVPHWS
jgi:hypothetical protein